MLSLPGRLRSVTTPQQPFRTLCRVNLLSVSPDAEGWSSLSIKSRMLVLHALHKNSGNPGGQVQLCWPCSGLEMLKMAWF